MLFSCCQLQSEVSPTKVPAKRTLSTTVSHSKPPVQVTLISRRPKGGRLVRGIANEDKLLAMLRDMPNLEPRLVDLASMSLQEQLQLVTQTDLLIGDTSANQLSVSCDSVTHFYASITPQTDGCWATSPLPMACLLPSHGQLA